MKPLRVAVISTLLSVVFVATKLYKAETFDPINSNSFGAKGAGNSEKTVFSKNLQTRFCLRVIGGGNFLSASVSLLLMYLCIQLAI